MSAALRDTIRILHATSLFVVAVFAMAAVFYSLFCIFGMAEWVQLDATLGGIAFPNAGAWIQGGLTVMLAAMVFFLPTHARILTLERSHRNFHIAMDDVARAYHDVHEADRAGLFTLSSEFDAVRERLAFLRDHPDLSRLEHDVMEVAAQMSVQSRHLAEIYSNERVARAKTFLAQRQQEAEDQQERILDALHICEQIRAWSAQVNLEEARVASQLAHLDEKLQDTLPLLGYALEHDPARDDVPPAAPPRRQAQAGTNIVNLPQKPATE